VLELRLLRYFVAVAETEHVGRAAERLHISQSPLSRQVRQLEAQLGLSLFRREKQRVRLTHEGRWLLTEARALLDRASRLERDAARRARGEAGTLSVGFVRTAIWNRLLPSALRHFARAHPEVRVDLRILASEAQFEELRRGELDLGLTHATPRGTDLVAVELLVEPFLLAVPRGYPLAAKKRVAPEDLQGKAGVVLSRAVHTASYDRLVAAGARAGFVLDVRAEASDHATVLGLVESGAGVALVPASARTAGRGVVFRDVPWFHLKTRLLLVKRAGSVPPPVAALAATLVARAPRRER
jgi:DNA-binding transcriptional LysR family regulator